MPSGHMLVASFVKHPSIAQLEERRTSMPPEDLGCSEVVGSIPTRRDVVFSTLLHRDQDPRYESMMFSSSRVAM